MEWMVAVDAGLSVDVAEDSVGVSEMVIAGVLNRPGHEHRPSFAVAAVEKLTVIINTILDKKILRLVPVVEAAAAVVAAFVSDGYNCSGVVVTAVARLLGGAVVFDCWAAFVVVVQFPTEHGVAAASVQYFV